MEMPGPSLKRPWPFREHEQNSATPTSPSSSEQVGDIADKNTCFGSIIGEKAQLNRHMERHVLSSQSFAVVREGDYFALGTGEHSFARLTKGISRKLHALDTGSQVCLRAYVPRNALGTAQSWALQPLTELPLEINVYGSRSDAEEVGTILSKSGTFLQLPDYGLENAEYYNPHFFRVEGFPDQFPIETQLSSTEDEVETLGHSESGEGQVDNSAAVDSILDSLSHHANLRDVPIDGRIKSALLPHQKEAIDFISKRETGTVPSKLSLWKYNDIDADEPFYQHVFTGAKRPKQEEAEGGIIADEMGLGKSLVILSTIAGSLDRAEKFVASENHGSTQRPAKAASRATLILAPSSLLIDNWLNEIHKHVYPASLSVHKHLGRGRHKETQLLCQREIVFTTYATVAKEFSGGKSALAKINWFRIVLDEAHDIRNRQTNQFRAVTELSGKHRWCLTGTPIQNSLEDLGALVSFLKVPILEKAQTFRKAITSPAATLSKDRFQNLQTLLQTICLRRTKQLLHLPPPTSHVREVYLTASERQQYNNLVQQGQIEIQMAVSGRIKKGINSIVLNSLLKLRLFCNNGSEHNTLQTAPTRLPLDADEALTYLQQHEENVCVFCSGIIYSIGDSEETDGGRFLSSCCHLVCRNCTPQLRSGNGPCPTCELGNGSTFSEILSPVGSHTHSYNGVTSYHEYPSKLLALLSDIRNDATHKSIVFSSWKKTLDIVSKLLSNNSIRHDIIHGACTLAERSKALKRFESDDGPNVLLMTLGTGAVGLNLACASRIYLLEPQWNPSIETQAIGRALRLGQTDRVVIVRYIVKDTVEQADVLSRQRRKIHLAGGGFGKGKEDMPPETLQSLLRVFNVDGASVVQDTTSLSTSIR
ncbi:hypothetical protein MRS44_018308 [Fusarium solani]|uniref:uncharacterized protein n=1 Tax=Fusarium solani TaxID=169388 RepID=UPI0032C3DF2C|nr:hypothetical protein MRS44_018308 [Fusarium solani]